MRIKLFLMVLTLSVVFPAKVFCAEHQQYQRIISFGSFITESLYALGAEDRIVGVTTYCQRPESAKLKEKAGNIVEVNLEKVLSLKPDLVLTTPLTDAKAKEKLKALGINVVDLGQVSDFSQICQQFLRIGEIVGEKQKAEQIIVQAQARVAKVRERVSLLPKPKVFIQVGTKPLFTMNKDFFVNDLLKTAGGINIAENIPSGIYSREKVVAENPDVIIVATMGVSGEDEKNIWMKYPQIRAVAENRVYAIDPYLVCSPTPDNFANALEIIAGFLHESGDGK